MAKANVSKQMLLDGAQMAASALCGSTMGFLKQRGIQIEDWVSYIGENFEGSLGDLEGEGVYQVMQHLLGLQVLPLGAEIISTDFTEDKAEVTLTTLPSRTLLEKFGTTPRELLRGFGLTQKDFESIYAMYEPAAKAIGLRFTHQLKGGQQLLSLERVPRRGKPRAGRGAKKT
jgi:hypothetical protein